MRGRKECEGDCNMFKRNVVVGMILFVLFAISLYFVDYSQYGSAEVAKYNEGYGTFDMKTYDSDTVQTVLSKMTTEGIQVYKNYYLVDGIFIIFFGLFQCFISLRTYSFIKGLSPKLFICFLPIMRGFCDIIENALIYRTISTFPNIDTSMIGIANVFTLIKLWTIRVWILEIMIGIVWSMIRKMMKKRKNGYDNKRKYYI